MTWGRLVWFAAQRGYRVSDFAWLAVAELAALAGASDDKPTSPARDYDSVFTI